MELRSNCSSESKDQMQRQRLHSHVHGVQSQVEDCMEAENKEVENPLKMEYGSNEDPIQRSSLRGWLWVPDWRSSVTRPGDLVFPIESNGTK